MNIPAQRVLINSLPKSGTHLLTRSVELFGYKEYFTQRGIIAKMREKLGMGAPKLLNYRQALLSRKVQAEDTQHLIPIGALSPYYVNVPTARAWFDSYPHDYYVHGHVPFSTELAEILDHYEYRHLIIMRDPSAVVVSQLKHILYNNDQTGMGMHFLHQDFASLDAQQQLDFLLNGGFAQHAGVAMQDFHRVYESMLAWRDAPGCLLIKFEDLVGEQGGGSAEQQRATVEKIAEHLGHNKPQATQIEGIYSAQSRTFNSGKIGAWQDNLSDAQVEQLNEYCAPLRAMAGYS